MIKLPPVASALFDFGNPILADMQGFGDALLGEITRAAELLKRHFLGDFCRRPAVSINT